MLDVTTHFEMSIIFPCLTIVRTEDFFPDGDSTPSMNLTSNLVYA